MRTNSLESICFFTTCLTTMSGIGPSFKPSIDGCDEGESPLPIMVLEENCVRPCADGPASAPRRQLVARGSDSSGFEWAPGVASPSASP